MNIIVFKTVLLCFVLRHIYSVPVKPFYEKKSEKGKTLFGSVNIQPKHDNHFQQSGIDVTESGYQLYTYSGTKLVYSYGGLFHLSRMLKQRHLAYLHYDLTFSDNS